MLREMGAKIVERRPRWGDPSQAMWHGIWVPGFAGEHDMLDWDSLHGDVDENLIELIHEGVGSPVSTTVAPTRSAVACGTPGPSS